MKEKNKDSLQKHNSFNYIYRTFFFPSILVVTSFNYIEGKSPDILEQFVDNYLIIVESKMKNSPKLWLDIKEGYSRQKTIYFSNLVMDSLDTSLSGYYAAIRHVPTIDSLRRVALSGGEFEYIIKKTGKANFRENYFSTSIE